MTEKIFKFPSTPHLKKYDNKFATSADIVKLFYKDILDEKLEDLASE